MDFPCVSVGWKAEFNGEEYGNYILVNPSDPRFLDSLNENINLLVVNYFESAQKIPYGAPDEPFELIIKKWDSCNGFDPLKQV